MRDWQTPLIQVEAIFLPLRAESRWGPLDSPISDLEEVNKVRISSNTSLSDSIFSDFHDDSRCQRLPDAKSD